VLDGDRVLGRPRRQRLGAEEQSVSGTLPAVLRTLLGRRSHRLNLAHRRTGYVPLRHHQVGHVINRCSLRSRDHGDFFLFVRY